ncbi:hypothetical protein TIFTF001_004651 [Ficus carica]|uniref:Uncharacterized protein n=1 Tax=Ficus carica TaxID=3494 RepID=A0AA87ZJZ2_FICCA|nr:hypothetical protein TIFTF001_004651 [Ficus carica]
MDQIHGGSRWLALVDLLVCVERRQRIWVRAREVHGGSQWRISRFSWSPAAAALVRAGEARDSAERLTAARALNGDGFAIAQGGFAGGKVLGAGGGEVSDGCQENLVWEKILGLNFRVKI